MVQKIKWLLASQVPDTVKTWFCMFPDVRYTDPCCTCINDYVHSKFYFFTYNETVGCMKQNHLANLPKRTAI